jgi:hypothetical protein
MRAMTEQSNSIEFLYASAVLLKLYKAKVISREVYERAVEKCGKRLQAM